MLIVVLNVVNTTGEYVLGKFAVHAAVAQFGSGAEPLDARQKFIGGFYGDFFSYVNLASLLLQMFAVSRIIAVPGSGRRHVRPPHRGVLRLSSRSSGGRP